MIIEGPNNKKYDAATITVATGQTNRDIAANNTTLWANVSDARYMSLTTDAVVTIRLNSTSNPAISIAATESPKVWKRTEQGMVINNIFVTNASGGTATMKVELYQ